MNAECGAVMTDSAMVNIRQKAKSPIEDWKNARTGACPVRVKSSGLRLCHALPVRP